MYRRQLDGKTLHFWHTGYVYRGSFVMFDRGTESEWLHVTGEAVMGPLKGKTVELLPSRLANWKAWKAAHPNTTVYASRRQWTQNSRKRITFGKSASRTQKLGLNVIVDDATKMYPYTDLELSGVINDALGTTPLAAVFTPGAECAVAWKRTVGDKALTFTPVLSKTKQHRLQDKETGSHWHPLKGTALTGPLRGKQLQPLVAIPIRLHRYRAFYPQGKVYKPQVGLFSWQRGIALRSRKNKDMTAWLWFYEWNLFDAIKPGQTTNGSYQSRKHVTTDGTNAKILTRSMTLTMRAADDGAHLSLTVRNTSKHTWPEIAAVIPCFNPGPKEQRNVQFANTNTYYLAQEGLKKLHKREIHFNHTYRKQINKQAKDGKFAFSFKWPTSQVDATGGLLLRESSDGKWVAGIAWENFLSAQGHNPWQCMHLSIRVGSLKPGESKTIHGRIYLFEGDRAACLRKYRRDFTQRK